MYSETAEGSNRAHENDKGRPNLFRDSEKKYRAVYGKKNKLKPTNFSSVVDFNEADKFNCIKKMKAQPVQSKYFQQIDYVYSLETVPGLYFIPNPFSNDQQKFWINEAIKNYTVGHPTNITNLNKSAPFTEFKPHNLVDLRWAALGYHFQWTERIYSEAFKGPFPVDLAELVSDLAATIGETIIAEAAIVNFYPNSKCQMGAHVDDAEEEMTKPIVSLSFGNTVVFMIGGRTRDVVPTALFIRSGDIVLMSGEARYCYHSVPRMISGTVPSSFLTDVDEIEGQEDSTGWAVCKNYIADARININCRQVKKTN